MREGAHQARATLGDPAKAPTSTGAPPHATQACRQVDACSWVSRRGGTVRCRRPGLDLEIPDDCGRDEARARGIDVLVPMTRLAVHVKAMRYDQCQLVFGS